MQTIFYLLVLFLFVFETFIVVCFAEVTENNLGNDDELRKAHKEFKTKNKEMKTVHRELNKKFDHLSKQVNEVKMDEDFSDFRVYQLYAMAKKTAMSKEELENFKVC